MASLSTGFIMFVYYKNKQQHHDAVNISPMPAKSGLHEALWASSIVW